MLRKGVVVGEEERGDMNKIGVRVKAGNYQREQRSVVVNGLESSLEVEKEETNMRFQVKTKKCIVQVEIFLSGEILKPSIATGSFYLEKETDVVNQAMNAKGLNATMKKEFNIEASCQGLLFKIKLGLRFTHHSLSVAARHTQSVIRRRKHSAHSFLPVEPASLPNPSIDSRAPVLVLFVGGCTQAEVSAVRAVSRETGRRHVVLTTGMVSGPSVIDIFRRAAEVMEGGDQNGSMALWDEDDNNKTGDEPGLNRKKTVIDDRLRSAPEDSSNAPGVDDFTQMLNSNSTNRPKVSLRKCNTGRNCKACAMM